MHIGIAKITIRIPLSQSLKAKRRVVKSLCDRVRSRYPVSVSEVAHQDQWQLASIGIAYVNSELRSRGISRLSPSAQTQIPL